MSSDDECMIINASELQDSVPVKNQNKEMAETEYSCPICPHTSTNIRTLEIHIENEHFNPNQDSSDSTNTAAVGTFSCPLCDQEFTTPIHLNKHFQAVHDQHLMESASTSCGETEYSCPLCFCNFLSAEILKEHVDSHFSSKSAEDAELAGHMQKEEEKFLQYQERKEFKRLQALYGFEKGKNISRQGDANLFRSAQNGNISLVDYHEKRILLKVSEKNGVDAGSSVTRDVVPHLRKLSTTLDSLWLCNSLDHYAASHGDAGWGCGYRNIQMLLSALLRYPQYCERLGKFFSACVPTTSNSNIITVPSITRLQSAIEEAWKLGFDVQGCEQLGGKLKDTCKWIGATEIATLLASCRIRYRLIDFHRPSSEDQKFHPALFDWVKRYFQKSSDFKPPLYFQHQGHSRTIVGIEEGKGKQPKLRLLILDPSHKHEQMSLLTGSVDPQHSKMGFAKKIWVPLTALKAKQYQLVCVDDGFVDDEHEYLNSRVLRSTRIP